MNNNGLMTGVVMVIIFALGIFLGYYFGTAAGVEKEEFEVGTEMNDGSVAGAVPAEGMNIDASMLTDGQKQVLRTMRVDVESLVITPEMVACAEAKVGSERLAAIQGGDSPSMSEGASLLACYN